MHFTSILAMCHDFDRSSVALKITEIATPCPDEFLLQGYHLAQIDRHQPGLQFQDTAPRTAGQNSAARPWPELRDRVSHQSNCQRDLPM